MQLDAHGLPARIALERSARTLEVEQVEEVWRVAEAWWREDPIRRTYYRLVVDGGRDLTLFHDDEAGGLLAAAPRWFEQRYGDPAAGASQ